MKEFDINENYFPSIRDALIKKWGQVTTKQMWGMICERAVCEIYNLDRCDGLVYDADYNGLRIEVKSTRLTREPHKNFNFAIAEKDAKKPFDIMICVFSWPAMNKIYIIGAIEKSNIPKEGCYLTTGPLTEHGPVYNIHVGNFRDPLILLAQSRLSTFAQ